MGVLCKKNVYNAISKLITRINFYAEAIHATHFKCGLITKFIPSPSPQQHKIISYSRPCIKAGTISKKVCKPSAGAINCSEPRVRR